MRRRFSPAAASRFEHLGEAARLVVEAHEQAGRVGAGRARRVPPEHQEARDVGRTVVEAGLRDREVEQLGRERRGQRRRARRRAPAPPRPRPTGAATIAAPPTASTSPAAQRAAATGCAYTRSTPAVVPECVSSACAASMMISADDQQIRIEEVVERVRDQALRRLLDGHDAVVGAPPHLAEHLAQARGGT